MSKNQKKRTYRYSRNIYDKYPLYSFLWKCIRSGLIFFCAFTFLCGLIYTAYLKLDEAFFAPVDSKSTVDVSFSVTSGSSLSTVAKELEEKGLIHNSTVFKYVADFRGLGQRIQAGSYNLSQGMSSEEILSQLISGDGKPNTMRITIIPGWTVEDIADYLVKTGVISSKELFLNECNNIQKYIGFEFIGEIANKNQIDDRMYSLEGYLSPNTYEIYTSSTSETIIRLLLNQTTAVFLNSYIERSEGLGFTVDEILTLASMIEKEAKTSDFAKVSAVFHNRLKSNMTLGSDATVKYISHSQKMSLNEDDLAVDSKYNTYLYKGLPAGPICNPSMDAIVAALYPDEQYIAQKYLYFCSTEPSSGELHFSRTLEEHNAAVATYRPLWEEYDKNRGLIQ